ncbi:MAG: hypothetical protein UH687_02585 [Bacteroidaceae bacterium]|nr:hypothetical protein [Bacteroidaceae bacterium]
MSLFVNGQVLPEEKQYSDNHSHSIEDDEERKNTPSIGFDPSSVRLQKRYRPLENDSLFPKQWWRRFYFGIGGGIQGLTDNIGMVSNASANAYLGYHLTPIHSLRLSGSYIKYNFNGNNKSAKSLGVGIDYLVNLSNFAWGYDPSRVFEVSTVVGIGARYSRAALPSKINPYAHIGLNADVYISKYASLFFEPYIGAQRQMSTVLNNPSREKWNLMYGFSTGLQVSLENRTDYFSEADSIYKKIFLDTSIGVVSSGRSGGILNRLGVGYQAALGLWINPMIGLRVGAHGESFYWTSRIRNKNNVPVRYSHNHVLVGGRAELMLDPLNFSKKWREAPEGHDFDLNLLLGGELGWELKNGLYGESIRRSHAYYYGITSALQALYRIDKGTYIYIEPRYQAIYYNDKKSEGWSPSDHIASINVGSRVYLTKPFSFRRPQGAYIPHWWVAIDAGALKYYNAPRVTKGGIGLNPTIGFAAGYDLSPWASFRAQLAYQRLYNVYTARYSGYAGSQKRYGEGLWESSYDAMDLRLSYMLNLNNLLQGYDAERRFNLWWTVGPSLTYIFNQSDTWIEGQKNVLPDLKHIELSNSREGKISPGINTSIMAALRVAPQYDVTVEAMGQYNFIHGTNPGNNPRLNNVKYGLTVGSRYHIYQRSDRQRLWPRFNRYFFDSSFAWSTSSLSNAFKLSGTQYSASLGMWFTPYIGARLGVNAQTMYHSSNVSKQNGVDIRKSKSIATGSARAELVVSPLNLFPKWRDKEGGHDFDVNLLGGLDLGGIARTPSERDPERLQFYYGLTGAMQLLYHINNPGTYIFVEPRFLSAYYKRPYYNTGVYETVSDKMFSLGVGTRVYMDNPSFVPVGSEEMKPRWWAGLSFGGVKLQRSEAWRPTSGLGLNPALAMSVGYDWKPLVSFRAQLAYERIGNYASSSYTGINENGKTVHGYGLWNSKYNVMDLCLAYMLNVNNFLQGYNPNRRFNLWLIGGPALTWILSENNTFVEGQNTTYKPLRELELSTSRSGRVSPAVSMSMMASMAVAKDIDVTAEVMGQYNFIHATNPGSNPIMNNLKYGFTIGGRYYIKPFKLNILEEYKSQPWHSGWQLEGSYGWALPMDTKNAFRSSGSAMYASLGYWFNSLLGARLGIGGNQTYWTENSVSAVKEPVSGVTVHAPYTIYKSQTAVGGRMELMLNPLNLLKSRREAEAAPRWDMNMSLGMNFGGMLKVQGLSRGYVGFTGAVSALYRLSNTVQLYVEPRYDSYSYNVYNKEIMCNESFSDRMFTVSVGARISRPVQQKEKAEDKEGLAGAHRGWWIAVSLGGSKMMQTLRVRSGGTTVNPSFALSAGYDFTRLHGMSLQLSTDIHSRQRPGQPYSVLSYGLERNYTGMLDSRYCMMDARLMYMLNMTNLWTGQDRRNALDVYLQFGPSVSTILSESNRLADGELAGGSNFKYTGKRYAGETSMGLVMGILASLPLNQNWALTAEASGQGYFNRSFMPEEHNHFMNNLKINFSVGTRYSF